LLNDSQKRKLDKVADTIIEFIPFLGEKETLWEQDWVPIDWPVMGAPARRVRYPSRGRGNPDDPQLPRGSGANGRGSSGGGGGGGGGGGY